MKIALIFFLFLILTTTSVQAGTNNYGQYGQYGGGGPSYNITIDKMVGTASTSKGGVSAYVDNYAVSDPRFKPTQQVYFQIKVKNTSNITLSNVEVKDILPEYVDAVEGPGSFDKNTRTISWKYDELKAGEEKTERVIAQIYNQYNLPADKGVMCMTNLAQVKAENAFDDDTAQFCVEKTVEQTKSGVPTQTPTAGPEYGIVLSALSMLGLGTGIYLKRKI